MNFVQVDDEGHEYRLIYEIVDYKKMGDAISGDDAYIEVNGRKC
jgi:hypothetical protein